MNVVEFFEKFYPMIISITLILLLITYWILIYRIRKLQKSMEKFDGRFQKLEVLFNGVLVKIKDIAQVVQHLDILKTGELKITGKTPIGDVNLNVNLGQLVEGKKEEPPRWEP